jgi:C1A family cysteine protease
MAMRAACLAAAAPNGLWAEPFKQPAAGMIDPPIALESPSRLFLYWNTEDTEGDPGEDNGATIADTCESDLRFGMCPEADWDYVAANFLQPPPDAAYAAARQVLGPPVLAVAPGVPEIKAAIYQGRPVQFGAYLRESFQAIGPDGVYAPAGGILGGHALYACGWDDARRMIEVPNSWGPAFGDCGVVWIPYDVIEDAACSDFVAVGGLA